MGSTLKLFSNSCSATNCSRLSGRFNLPSCTLVAISQPLEVLKYSLLSLIISRTRVESRGSSAIHARKRWVLAMHAYKATNPFLCLQKRPIDLVEAAHQNQVRSKSCLWRYRVHAWQVFAQMGQFVRLVCRFCNYNLFTCHHTLQQFG